MRIDRSTSFKIFKNIKAIYYFQRYSVKEIFQVTLSFSGFFFKLLQRFEET